MIYFRFEKVKIQLYDNFAGGNHSIFQFDITQVVYHFYFMI